jgi:alkyl sulfatase BDS1-like metallo-beta-lactamase superfamily hydrolase
MKKTAMALAAAMIFGYAAAQVEPQTAQKKTTDTIQIPVNDKSDDNIANKGILHRNTLEAGIGKPDNIKRKINKRTRPTDPQIIPRVKVDTTTPKRAVRIRK